MTASAKTLRARDLSEKLLEWPAIVTARCIGCGMKRDIAAKEIAPGDHPCCNSCGMPMIAEHAAALKRKRTGRR